MGNFDEKRSSEKVYKFEKMRWQAWHYLCEKVFKIQVGDRLTKVMLVISCILFPKNMIMHLLHKANPINYDVWSNTVEIFGMRYSMELFYEWSNDGWKEGTIFQLDKRENGCCVLTLINKHKTQGE